MSNVVALVVVLGALSGIVFGQVKEVSPDSLGQTTVDTLQHLDDEGEWLWQHRTTVPQVIGNDKAAIEENRIFDLSVQPLTVGERESVEVELGNFQKIRANFVPALKTLSGKLKLGYGSYSSPSFEGWVGTASAMSDVLVRGSFTSTNGRHPNQDYYSGDAGLAAGVFFSKNAGMFSGGRLQADVDFSRQQYRLYGSATPTRLRTVSSIENVIGLKANYVNDDYLHASLNLTNLFMIDSVRNTEHYAGFEVSGGATIDRTRLLLGLQGWKSFSTASSPNQDPQFASFAAGAEYRVSEGISVTGGGTLYLEQGSDSESRTLLQPRFGVEWYAANGLKFYGRYEPYVERNSLQKFARSNPYLSYNINVRNTEFFSRISVGATSEIGKGVAAGVSFTYSKADNHPVFSVTPANVWSIDYGSATRIFVFHSEVHAEIVGKHTLGFVFTGRSARITLKSDTLGMLETGLPYYPDVAISGSYRHRLSPRFMAGSAIRFIGRQFADVVNSRQLSSFVVWDMQAEYEIARRLLVAVSVENILDQQQQWWEQYAGESRRVRLSIDFSW
ncbi:MAG: TonB-dependent receptor [Bacteroidetes bacterium]|nr:TonB-dependent receptor [Bacteroidota bacterium]MCW5894056.1 TonB-dependent receptor [Bacteroidota bacterium]